MRADAELIEQVVEKILGRLSGAGKVQNVLVIGSRQDLSSLRIPGDEGDRNILFLEDAAGAASLHIDRYVLPRLELDDMTDLAAGKAGSEIAGLVRELLLKGKCVEVLEYAYQDFEHTAPAAMLKMYADYEEALKHFGLKPFTTVRRSVRLAKKVVGEQDIEHCGEQGCRVIKLSGNTIVTPLAVERARTLGIEIQRD